MDRNRFDTWLYGIIMKEPSRRVVLAIYALAAIVYFVLGIHMYRRGRLADYLVGVVLPFYLSMAVLELAAWLLKDYVKRRQKMEDGEGNDSAPGFTA